MADNDHFDLFKRKDIYEILDGDRKFDEYKFIDDGTSILVSMPYLSGPILCSISTQFGLPKTYGNATQSRWQYLDDLFTHCIEHNSCSNLLVYLFSKPQFIPLLKDHTANAIDNAYTYFVQSIIDNINGLLYFSDYQLIYNNKCCYMESIKTSVGVQTPEIKVIDQQYINNLSNRALEDIENNDFDSAITKSRTLLEETFWYVIEKAGETPSTSGNINDLYKQVKDLYHMHGDANTDKRINTLLSGLEKIITSISEMRNKISDAHGAGANRIKIKDYHARLLINSAMTVSEFILSVASESNLKNH